MSILTKFLHKVILSVVKCSEGRLHRNQILPVIIDIIPSVKSYQGPSSNFELSIFLLIFSLIYQELVKSDQF